MSNATINVRCLVNFMRVSSPTARQCNKIRAAGQTEVVRRCGGNRHADRWYRIRPRIAYRLFAANYLALAFSRTLPSSTSTANSTAEEPYSWRSCSVFFFTNFWNDSKFPAGPLDFDAWLA